MARIPILKLNNGTTNYYPFSVGEAVVTTHPIEVTNNIGGYKVGDRIEAVTTLDAILTKLFTGVNDSSSSGSTTATDVDVDGVTIVKDADGKLKVAAVSQSAVTGLSDSLSAATSSAVSQSTTLVNDLKTELDDKIDGLKFRNDETFEITSTSDMVNVLKDILLRLGALENNVTVNINAVTNTGGEGPDEQPTDY